MGAGLPAKKKKCGELTKMGRTGLFANKPGKAPKNGGQAFLQINPTDLQKMGGGLSAQKPSLEIKVTRPVKIRLQGFTQNLL